MEIVEKNTSEFEPGPHSEVKKISPGTVRGCRRKNQEREKPRGLINQQRVIDARGTIPQIYANLKRQSVIRVQRRDTLLKFVDRRQRVRHLSKNYDICRKTSVVRHLSKKSKDYMGFIRNLKLRNAQSTYRSDRSRIRGHED